ncbi:MAG: hypothetical protein AABX12_04320 [Nanoarchaeota archaeon]
MIFNKKGQGMPLSVIITAVIVVVVALVLILVTTDFGKKLMGLGQATPSALEAATQGCINAANNNLVTDYCYNFRKVGNTQYVNCEDARIQSSITQQGITHSIVCDATVGGLEDKEKNTICKGLTTNQKNDVTFNDAKYACPVIPPAS